MYNTLTTIKPNETHRELLKLFKGKRILFLENSNGLHDGSTANLELWLIENKIRYNCLFHVKEAGLDYIVDQINSFQIIVFETQWVYEISFQLKEHIAAMKDKKTIVECYTSKPTWYYKPKAVHDIYVLDSFDEDMDEWQLNKLRIKKAIWED